jgi:hypothetical protein
VKPHSVLRYMVFGLAAGFVAGLLTATLHLNFTWTVSALGVVAGLLAGVGTRTGRGVLA